MRTIITWLILLLSLSTLSAQLSMSSGAVGEEPVVNGFSNFFLGTNYAEPYIATNPRDSLNTICSFIYGSYYTLDGVNWNSIGMLNSMDPFLTFDSIGNAYYVPAPPWNYVNYAVRKSTDKGITWQFTYQILNGYTDKPCICAVQSGGMFSNFLYTAWQQYPMGLFFSRSDDQGATWNYNMLNTPSNYYCPYLAVGPSANVPGGIIYYGYNTYNENDNTIIVFVRKSTDSGLSFFPQIKASPVFIHPYPIKNNTIGVNACIQMSADNSYSPYRGNVYIVYTVKGQGTDNCDVHFIKSTNYGNNWSAPIKLNNDNTLNDQWMPAISVSNNGRIYVVWYDSRFDPQNLQTLLYGTYSTNGGASFVNDFPVSTTPFNPLQMVINGFMGHYISVSAIGNSAIAAWTDGRNKNYGSFVGYLPDFAMTVNPASKNIVNNDSAIITVKIPSEKGGFNRRINFYSSVDTIPASGNINLSFVNGKNFITSIPDSVKIRLQTSGSVTPGLYRLRITGRSMDGVPVHQRFVILYVNIALITVGTNRNDTALFKVNGVTYTRRQEFILPFNSQLSVQAMSPFTMAFKKFIYTHWSDAGDTAHTVVTGANNLDLTAFYRLQLKLSLVSSQGNSFGGNVFFDSGASGTIGVNSKYVTNGGITYRFRGWSGSGQGSYTSSDSTGNDTVITISNIINPITETVRWIPITGISNISENIPKKFKLHYNYPNPFNPVTTIKFDIPNKIPSSEGWQPKANGVDLVKLTIYDMLGREVAVLVNEQLKPGSYSVTWNASNYSSGVYFYRITAGEHADIKRMILLK
jgi:hypothetical protein